MRKLEKCKRFGLGSLTVICIRLILFGLVLAMRLFGHRAESFALHTICPSLKQLNRGNFSNLISDQWSPYILSSINAVGRVDASIAISNRNSSERCKRMKENVTETRNFITHSALLRHNHTMCYNSQNPSVPWVYCGGERRRVHVLHDNRNEMQMVDQSECESSMRLSLDVALEWMPYSMQHKFHFSYRLFIHTLSLVLCFGSSTSASTRAVSI